MTLRRLEQVNGCLFIAVTHSNRLLAFLLVHFHPAFYNFFVYFLLFSLNFYMRTKNNTATLTLQRCRTARRARAGRWQAGNTQQLLAG
jgi:hypothetical protein